MRLKKRLIILVALLAIGGTAVITTTSTNAIASHRAQTVSSGHF